MTSLGKLLAVAGLLFVVAGGVVMAAERMGVRLGRLPGDIVWRGKNATVYLPLATSIVISLVLTVIFWIVGRLGR